MIKHLPSLLYELPKATAQQSLEFSFCSASGSISATGTFFCLGSHTRTHPSFPPVTISGGPYPLVPAQPSIELIIPL